MNHRSPTAPDGSTGSYSEDRRKIKVKRKIVLKLDNNAKQILLHALKKHKTLRKVELKRNPDNSCPSLYFDEAKILEDLANQVIEQWNQALPSIPSTPRK